MSRDAAERLFGAEAVDRALAERSPDPASAELAEEVRRLADPPGAFRAWALAQPWPRFAAVVRIVAGATRRDLLDAAPVDAGAPPSKLARIRALMSAEAWDAALALAAKFPRLGDEATARAIRRGHEAAARPDFQRQLGRDPGTLRAAGIVALRERYDETKKGEGTAMGTNTRRTGARAAVRGARGCAKGGAHNASLATARVSGSCAAGSRKEDGDVHSRERLQVSIRVDIDVWDRLAALARRTPLDRAALAREAMRIGAEAIERDPGAALDRDRRELEAADARLAWGFGTADPTARREGRALPLEAIRAGYAVRADPKGLEADMTRLLEAGRVERITLEDGGGPALRWVGLRAHAPADGRQADAPAR